MIHLLLGAAAVYGAKHIHKAITNHAIKHGSKIMGTAWSQGANHVHKHTADFIAKQVAQNGSIKFK